MNTLEIIAVALMGLGALFTLLAGVGVVRMPDVYSRLSATSKAAPFGVGLVLAGSALVLGETSFALQAGAVGLFLVATAPVAAHGLARAAYRAGAPVAPQTRIDERLEHPGPATAPPPEVRR